MVISEVRSHLVSSDVEMVNSVLTTNEICSHLIHSNEQSGCFRKFITTQCLTALSLCEFEVV